MFYRRRRSPRETIRAERTDEYEQVLESSKIRSTYFEQRIGETYIIRVQVKILVKTRFSSYNERSSRMNYNEKIKNKIK